MPKNPASGICASRLMSWNPTYGLYDEKSDEEVTRDDDYATSQSTAPVRPRSIQNTPAISSCV